MLLSEVGDGKEEVLACTRTLVNLVAATMHQYPAEAREFWAAYLDNVNALLTAKEAVVEAKARLLDDLS